VKHCFPLELEGSHLRNLLMKKSCSKWSTSGKDEIRKLWATHDRRDQYLLEFLCLNNVNPRVYRYSKNLKVPENCPVCSVPLTLEHSRRDCKFTSSLTQQIQTYLGLDLVCLDSLKHTSLSTTQLDNLKDLIIVYSTTFKQFIYRISVPIHTT
jgi:hypothetical protein